MLLLTIDHIPGRDFEPIGTVKGAVVQSKHIGKDLMAGLKTIVGGELSGYTEMLTEARQIATDRMIAEAVACGAHAVIGVRYASSALMDGAAEVMAYGTAIRFR